MDPRHYLEVLREQLKVLLGLSDLILKVLPVKYDFIGCIIVLWIHIDCNLATNMLWFIVSKAAVKSSNIRISKRLFFML